MAVYLVGPRPESAKGNRWILVSTDHFTLVIPDATIVAAALDERMLCYLGLPKWIHIDQGTLLWNIETPLLTTHR